jgi:hypothetical protein
MHLLTKMVTDPHHNVTSRMTRNDCSNSHDVPTDREVNGSAIGAKFPDQVSSVGRLL